MSKFTYLLGGLLNNNVERSLRAFRDKYLRRYKHEPLPADIYDGPFKKISYCITCKNRLYQLKQTLEQNLKDNKAYPDVEFVLINYNSQDGLEEWVKRNFSHYIDQGTLVYYRTPDPEVFNAPKAKNLSHRLATGDILCNLDGDNYTGRDNAFYINHLYKSEPHRVVRFYKAPFWGTVGRIVLSRKLFYEIGGHNEAFLPLGHEDIDLLDRARRYGSENYGSTYAEIKIENFLRFISNSAKEKAGSKEKRRNYFYECNEVNKATSRENLEKGNLIANPDGWGQALIYKNFSSMPVMLSKVRPNKTEVV